MEAYGFGEGANAALLCPSCKSPANRVVETKTRSHGYAERREIKRHRKCRECGTNWTTYEYIINETEPLEPVAPPTTKSESRLKRTVKAEDLHDINVLRKAVGLSPLGELPKPEK